MRCPLPPVEIDLFLATVDEALDLALARRAEDGAAELAHGLERAQAALSAGEPWAPEMVKRWQEALRNYCFKHWVKPPRPKDPDGEDTP